MLLAENILSMPEPHPVFCRNCFIPMKDLSNGGFYYRWVCEKCGLEWTNRPAGTLAAGNGWYAIAYHVVTPATMSRGAHVFGDGDQLTKK